MPDVASAINRESVLLTSSMHQAFSAVSSDQMPDWRDDRPEDGWREDAVRTSENVEEINISSGSNGAPSLSVARNAFKLESGSS